MTDERIQVVDNSLYQTTECAGHAGVCVSVMQRVSFGNTEVHGLVLVSEVAMEDMEEVKVNAAAGREDPFLYGVAMDAPTAREVASRLLRAAAMAEAIHARTQG